MGGRRWGGTARLATVVHVSLNPSVRPTSAAGGMGSTAAAGCRFCHAQTSSVRTISGLVQKQVLTGEIRITRPLRMCFPDGMFMIPGTSLAQHVITANIGRFSCFLSPFITFTLLPPAPSLVVTQIRSHIAGSSSPPPNPLPTTVRALHFYREKGSATFSPRRLAFYCD